MGRLQLKEFLKAEHDGGADNVLQITTAEPEEHRARFERRKQEWRRITDWTSVQYADIPFELMTTNDVCFGIVKPATEQVKISYAEMLSNTKADEAQDATVFVSHAWKYTFVDVVDALNSLSGNAYTCGSTCSQSTSARGCK